MAPLEIFRFLARGKVSSFTWIVLIGWLIVPRPGYNDLSGIFKEKEFKINKIIPVCLTTNREKLTAAFLTRTCNPHLEV
jgi:hypothetical protein